MTDGYDFVKSRGIMREKDYPYEANDNETCRYKVKKRVFKCSGFVELPFGSEDELMKAVATVGPVAAGIQASWLSMQFYQKGIYFEPNCDSLKVDHAVLVVGYSSEDGQDYWIIKNSWGDLWGEKGYLKL